MKNFIALLGLALIFQSCQIREEFTFKEDGSGTYEMGIDMSELMKSDLGTNDSIPQKSVDTLVVFSEWLDEKRDSISQLPKEEQEKLELLRPLEFSMNIDEEKKSMVMKLAYAFEEIDDIKKFGEAVKAANIKELDDLQSMSEGDPNGNGPKADLNSLFSTSTSFETKFSKSKFTRTITDEAMEAAIKQKDTTLTADDPFVDMLRFKQVYRFPYRVKSVSNSNAKIHADFMGVEIEANMFELNNYPEYFNVEVKFDK